MSEQWIRIIGDDTSSISDNSRADVDERSLPTCVVAGKRGRAIIFVIIIRGAAHEDRVSASRNRAIIPAFTPRERLPEGSYLHLTWITLVELCPYTRSSHARETETSPISDIIASIFYLRDRFFRGIYILRRIDRRRILFSRIIHREWENRNVFFANNRRLR